MSRFVFLAVAIFSLLRPQLQAQTTSVPVTHGPGGCKATTVSNASPPRITCTADPGWVDGDKVLFQYFKVSTPAYSGINGFRYVDRITATTYDIYSDAGLTTPLSAPGTYAINYAQWAAKTDGATLVIPNSLALWPDIFKFRCDEANGCLTGPIVVSGGVATATMVSGHGISWAATMGVYGSPFTSAAITAASSTTTTVTWNTGVADGSYSNIGISSRYFSANPAYTNLNNSCAASGYGPMVDQEAACALRYYITRDGADLTIAKQVILNPLIGVSQYAACGMGIDYCAIASGDIRNDTDWGRFSLELIAKTYELLDSLGQITAGEKSTFLEMLWASKKDAGGCSYQSTSSLTGTLSKIASSSTVTGSGTLFTSELVVNQIIVPSNRLNENTALQVLSIVSDTEITVGPASRLGGLGFSWSGISALKIAPWASGNCGLFQITRAHNAGGMGVVGVDAFGASVDQSTPYYNLATTQMWATILAGAAMVNDDSRARLALEEAVNTTWHQQLAVPLSLGGFLMGSAYGPWRSWMYKGIVENLRRWGYPDLRGDWTEAFASFVPWSWSGDPLSSGSWHTHHGDAALQMTAPNVSSWPDYAAGSPWMAHYKSFVKAACGGTVTSGCLANNNYGINSMRWYDPTLADVNFSSLPLARVEPGGTTADKSLCVGAFLCQASPAFSFAVSRSGWTGSHGSGADARIQFSGGGGVVGDHDVPSAGLYWIGLGTAVQNGHPLMSGSDASTGTLGKAVTSERANTFRLGAHAYRNPNFLANMLTSRMDRYSDPNTTTHLHVRSDAKGDFTPEPTTAYRDMLHARNAGLVFIRTSTVGLAGTAEIYTHLTQKTRTTCGGAACTGGGATISSVVRSENAGLSHFMEILTVYPDASKRGRKVFESSYAAGAGYTERLRVCATTDDVNCNTSATELAAIDVLALDETLTSAASITASGFEGVYAVSSGGSVAALFATSPQSSASFTLPGTADVFVSDLTPGTYNVVRDSTVVCAGLVVTSTSGSLWCASVSSGTITVTTGGAPPNVDTTSLPGGSVGVAYSQTLVASGGTSPYTWALVSGSLPGGLSLNSSSGAITGTPTTTGTFNFTVEVTDSAAGSDSQPLEIVITALPVDYRLRYRQGVIIR